MPGTIWDPRDIILNKIETISALMGLTVQNMADFRGGPCTVEHGAKEILQSASRPVESKYMAKLVVIQGLHSNPWEG